MIADVITRKQKQMGHSCLPWTRIIPFYINEKMSVYMNQTKTIALQQLTRIKQEWIVNQML